MFIMGTVMGIYIMTQVNNEQDRKRVNLLLELEDNLIQYKTEVNQLRVDKRIAEARLTISEAKLNPPKPYETIIIEA